MTMEPHCTRPSKDQMIQVLLRGLQAEAERGNAEQRSRNRALLRGFRCALWVAQDRASVSELEAVLREELGLPAAEAKTIRANLAHQPR